MTPAASSASYTSRKCSRKSSRASGHDDMRLHDLRRRRAKCRRGRGLYVGSRLQLVPLEQHDVMTPPREDQRGEYPRRASTSDDDLHQWIL